MWLKVIIKIYSIDIRKQLTQYNYCLNYWWNVIWQHGERNASWNKDRKERVLFQDNLKEVEVIDQSLIKECCLGLKVVFMSCEKRWI